MTSQQEIEALKKPKHTGNEIELGLTDDAQYRQGYNDAIDELSRRGLIQGPAFKVVEVFCNCGRTIKVESPQEGT